MWQYHIIWAITAKILENAQLPMTGERYIMHAVHGEIPLPLDLVAFGW